MCFTPQGWKAILEAAAVHKENMKPTELEICMLFYEMIDD
jgi:hypothetical protein